MIFTNGTDNVNYGGDLYRHEDDIYAFVGFWDGSVVRHSILLKE
jgi:hypothetical protein